jgi:hypothetical protein
VNLTVFLMSKLPPLSAGSGDQEYVLLTSPWTEIEFFQLPYYMHFWQIVNQTK